MKSGQIFELILPDQLCEKAGCKSIWGLGNNLFITAGSTFHGPRDGCAKFKSVNDEIIIQQVSWDAEMHKDAPRKLLSASKAIFCDIQQAFIDEELTSLSTVEDAKRINLFQYSQQYRSIIKEVQSDIQLTLNFEDETLEKKNLLYQEDTLNMIDFLWGLCEVLYFEKINHIMKQLLDWISFQFSYKIIESLLLNANPDSDPQYWDVIYKCTLHGKIDEVRKLLMLNKDSDTEIFKRMDNLLATMPVFKPISFDDQQSKNEWTYNWQQWHEFCVKQVEEKVFDQDYNLNFLCNLIAGDDVCFIELKKHIETWYSMLIYRLLYQNPMVNAEDLQLYSQFCIEEYGGSSKLNEWDQIILAFINLDVTQALSLCCSNFSNWWFSVHIADLLHKIGLIDSKILHFGSNIREFIILEYATSLMSNQSLWQIGIEYLSHCSVFGRSYISEWMLRIPIDTELKAQKLLRICQRFDLQDESRLICKELSLKALKHKQINTALNWSLKGKNTDLAMFIVNKFLTEHIDTDDKCSLDLISNLGSSVELNDQLAFLSKFAEFLNLKSIEDYERASNILLMLIAERTTKKKFLSLLLQNLLTLIESEKILISTVQSHKILQCMDDLNIFISSGVINDNIIFSKDLELRLRQAISNNLVKSLFI